jgi:hypothetical protein
MNRFALSSLALCALLAGCSSDNDTNNPGPSDAGADVSTVGDTAGLKNDGTPPADISTDPLPAAMADAVAREEPPGPSDLPLDLSCMGDPMPIKTSEPTDRSVKTAELGDEMALVPETDLEIFYSNKLEGTPDVKVTTAATTAEATVKIPIGFFLAHTKKTGMLETIAYDWWINEPIHTFAVASPDKVRALGALIGGSEYTHVPGTTRLVIVVKDCKRRDVANAHVVIEIGGKVVAPVTTGDGIRRNYFGDNELPSKATVTSRSGVVAFLNVPSASPVRFIAYGKVGGAVVPIGIRTVTPVADAVITANISPWNEP